MILKHLVFSAWILIGASATVKAESGTWPFVHPPDHFSKNALLDLRGMNEAVAGQSGFVRMSSDGRFLRGDGSPIRFWACGTDQFTGSADELAAHARFLAKIGVNMVRIHAQIGANGAAPALTDVNQKEIDAIWRAAAAFKKCGIYVTISPYWAMDRPATRWGIEGYQRHTDLWGLLFFNPTLQNGYKAWVTKLYTPINPYTGIPLARDPAVAILEIQNEDGMFFWTMDGIQPAQKRLLSRKFAAWLIKRYGSLDAASDAWDDVSADGDNFADAEAGIMPIEQWTRRQHDGKQRRLADQLEFFADTQRGFYSDMVKFYRQSLGCRQLINTSNWLTADAARLGDVERYTDTAGDVLAVNRYFNGIHEGKNSGWRIEPGDDYVNDFGVLDPWDLPTNLRQVVGHPMIVTESSWVSPLDDQDEGPFLTAAYESLGGVAGFYWFTATAGQYANDPRIPWATVDGQHPLRKYSCSTPMLMGNFPAAAIAYRNGYIRHGQPMVIENRKMDDLWNRQLPMIVEGSGFDPNRMTDQPQETDFQPQVDPLAFLVGPVMVNYGNDLGGSFAADLSKWIDRGGKTVTSDTGQIRMNYGLGLCTVDSAAAQGCSGFLKNAGTVHLSTVDISSENRQASVWVVSMDSRPLASSREVLVQVGTPGHPDGWKTEPADFGGRSGHKYHGLRVVNIGQPPWILDDVDVTILICNPNLRREIVLDVSGYAKAEMQLERNQVGVRLRLPSDAMYVVLR